MVLNQKQKNKRVGIVFFVILLILATIITLILLFSEKESYYSEQIDSTKTSAISCTKSLNNDSFFYDPNASDATEKVKISFYNNKPNKFFYNYLGNYDSEQTANTHSAMLQSRYNEFLGDRGLSPGSISSNFAYTDNIVRINIYAEIGDINKIGNAMFYIQEPESNSFIQNNEDEIINYYQKKEFICESIK